MGAQSTVAALTETRGGTAPAGHHLYVGIDAGRRHHVVAAIPTQRMENGSWERAGIHRTPTTSGGFRELTDWIRSLGYAVDQIAVGCEPTGGWYAQTVAAWLEGHGYEISWLQNFAIHERRQLLIGKQTKTDALDARLIARLLYERDAFGLRKGFLHHPPRSTDALRMLVRNRHQLVEQRTRYRLQLTAIVDVLFPELKDFFTTTITGLAARRLLEAYPTPEQLWQASLSDLHRVVVVEGGARRKAARLEDLRMAAYDSAGLVDNIEPIIAAQAWLLRQLRVVDEQIANVEGAFESALKDRPEQERAVLASLPLMTNLRQAVLIATIGDLDTFADDRQLRKFLGWYPELRESGTTMSKHRLGLSGNRLGRREIWLWCMQLLTPLAPNTPFRGYYKRLRDRGLSGNVAIGHLAGKLISVTFFCLRRGELYDPAKHSRELGLGDA